MLKGLKYPYVRFCCKFQFTVRKSIASFQMYFSGDLTVETYSFEAYFYEHFLSVWIICIGWFMGFEEFPKPPETDA